MLRPILDYVLDGSLPVDKFVVIPGLLPSIIGDMADSGEWKMARRFTDHPLALADYLLVSQPKLRCLTYSQDYSLPDLWDRAIEVANRYLTEKPIMIGETIRLP